MTVAQVLALPIFPGRHQPSIVGRDELNYRVRNGNGWTLALISTNYSFGLPEEHTDYNVFTAHCQESFYTRFVNQRSVCESERKSSGGNELSRLRGSE